MQLLYKCNCFSKELFKWCLLEVILYYSFFLNDWLYLNASWQCLISQIISGPKEEKNSSVSDHNDIYCSSFHFDFIHITRSFHVFVFFSCFMDCFSLCLKNEDWAGGDAWPTALLLYLHFIILCMCQEIATWWWKSLPAALLREWECVCLMWVPSRPPSPSSLCPPCVPFFLPFPAFVQMYLFGLKQRHWLLTRRGPHPSWLL